MYAITDFDRHYITGDMKRRKVKRPSWFKCPTDSPEVTSLIHGHPNGLAHLGCWNRLQGWAVTNWHSDGSFMTVEGGMTIEQIAIHVGLYGFEDVLREAITRLVAIGWMNESQEDCETLTAKTRDSRDRFADDVVNDSRDIDGTCRESIANDSRYIDGKCRESIAINSRSQYSTEHDKTEDKKGQGEKEPRWSKSNGWEGMTSDKVSELAAAFPSVDVPAELLRMSAWLTANPTKSRKRQWLRFVTNWLARSQESSSSSERPAASSAWGEEAEAS